MEARSCKHCCSGKAVVITYCECVFRLSYPACNAYAPYCHLWPARLYGIFPHYLINGTIFEKKVTGHKMMSFDFLYNFLSETFLILRRNERDTIKNVCWASCHLPVIVVRF